MPKQALAAITEFHHARLAALDNWDAVTDAMYAPGDAVSAVGQLLGVTNVGAYSVLAMMRGPMPERAHLEARLQMFERIHTLLHT